MIRSGYPLISRYNRKLAAYIVLLRPFTLLAPLAAGIFGTLLPLKDWGWAQFREAVYVGVTLALLQAVGQIVNQASDAELDRLAKPYRPIPRGEVTVEEAMGIAWLLAIFAMARAFFTSITFGLLSLTLLFMAVFYNIQPIRVKRYTWPNILWNGVARGFIPMIATWSIYGDLNSPTPYLLATLAFLWVTALNPTKDFPDMEYDRRFGIQTLPVKYGVKKATTIITAILGLWALQLAITITITGNHLLILTLPLTIPAILGLKVKTPLENNLAWQTYYVGLSLHYILAYLGR